MTGLRQALRWGTLGAIALLAGLAIVGAFLGAERAERLFNSPPLVVFWFVLAALLGGGLVWSGRLGMAAVHLGAVLVVFGSMLGSAGWYRLLWRMSGGDRVRCGYMVIFQRETTDRVIDRDRLRSARLPFELHLQRFWIEHYEPAAKTWELVAVCLGPDGAEKLVPLAGRVGEAMDIPGVDVRVEVVEFLPSARGDYLSDGRLLRAVPDPATGLPAMKLIVRWPDREQVGWLLADPATGVASMPLEPPAPETAPAGSQARRPVTLCLLQPLGPVKDYKSHVAIVEDGRVVAEKVIEVNSPLHYGGYHFYQYSCDEAGQQYTVISIRSDSGLWLVYGGLALACVGSFWQFWAVPAIARLKRAASHGG